MIARVASCAATDWPSPDAWARAAPVRLACFHPRSAPTNRPGVEARLLQAQERFLFVRFAVTAEMGVVARHTVPGSWVCQDSCVEVFLSVPGTIGYANVEVNAIGTSLAMHVRDPTPSTTRRTPFRDADVFDASAIAAFLTVRTSLPWGKVIDVPIPGASDWQATFRLDLPELARRCGGAVECLSGISLRANFYKCADAGPAPHWAAWADIGERLSFHQPERFGMLQFDQ
ncbi:MAG TPA: carbohydrate-binding family 9-like protein [Lacipirellulaceae bacterium]|nr:carbohydrate-binding family 9-like protein [Lacipirellulaceae bacterium]